MDSLLLIDDCSDKTRQELADNVTLLDWNLISQCRVLSHGSESHRDLLIFVFNYFMNESRTFDKSHLLVSLVSTGRRMERENIKQADHVPLQNQLWGPIL